MLKDKLGNELKKGDLVAVQLAQPLIFGRIDSIEEGGIVTGIRGGQEQIKATRIAVVSMHPIDIDPRLPVVPTLIAIRDPDVAIGQIAKAN